MSTRDDSAIENGLPDGWEWSTLGDVCEKTQYGWTTKANHETGKLKLLRTTDITSGSVDWSSVPFCTEEPEDIEKYLVESGDILISRAGSVGVSFLIHKPERAVFASYLIRFRPKSGIDTKYFYYYLKSAAYWEAIGASKSGIAVPNVNASKLAQVPIPVAPFDQQKRIVAEIEKQFSRLDEAVANLKRVKANLKRYKAAILKAAVEGCLVKTEAELARKRTPSPLAGEGGGEGAGYETGEQLLQRILETRRSQWKGKGKYKEPAAPDTTNLPELPEGWVWVTWEMILAPEEGSFRRGPFGSTLKKSIFVELGHKVYEQYNAINDDPSFGRYYITDGKYKSMKAFAVRAKDFLISCSGTIGRITQVPEHFESGIINQALLRVRTDKSVISDSYFLMLFRSPYFQRQILDNAQGAAMANVKGVVDLKAIPVPLPPIEDQMRITLEVDRRLSLIREVESQVDTNLKRTKRLRQSILAQAFSGKLFRHAIGKPETTSLLSTVTGMHNTAA